MLIAVNVNKHIFHMTNMHSFDISFKVRMLESTKNYALKTSPRKATRKLRLHSPEQTCNGKEMLHFKFIQIEQVRARPVTNTAMTTIGQ